MIEKVIERFGFLSKLSAYTFEFVGYIFIGTSIG
jgi:hypothetical protein